MSNVQEPEATVCPEEVATEFRESVPPDGQEDEELDPRVQDELEKLNVASEDINRFEKDLDGARNQFKQVTGEATVTLNSYKKGREKSIAKARPYFEMRREARKAHVTAQAAAQAYENAYSRHKAAREMVSRAEAHVLAGRSSQLAHGVGIPGGDAMAWMEVLDDASIKVMTTGKERAVSEEMHMKASGQFSECEKKVHHLFKENKRSINKAMPYFEQHAKYWLLLEKQKKKIVKLQADVVDAKSRYRLALANLEMISNEIHKSRLSQKLAREAIDGASSPETEPPGERTDGVGSEVNVDAVMESVTGLRLEYSTSLDSIDDLGEEGSTPDVLLRLDAMEEGDSSSLTPALSCDQISALAEVDENVAACSQEDSSACCVLEGDEDEAGNMPVPFPSLDGVASSTRGLNIAPEATQSLADELRQADSSIAMGDGSL